jgi:hypothetical protein
VYESDDHGATDPWNLISGNSGAFYAVTPGGQVMFNVITGKKWIKVTGYGTGGSGYAKMDFTYDGIQYFGGLDLDVSPGGKSGFALDTTPYTVFNGTGYYATDVWPEVPGTPDGVLTATPGVGGTD